MHISFQPYAPTNEMDKSHLGIIWNHQSLPPSKNIVLYLFIFNSTYSIPVLLIVLILFQSFY
jgi:hypothetical protein